jgi:hypothetical protein
MKKYINIVKNLIRWFPVIVKDRDYDDYFIFEILKTKLKHQAKYIGDRDIHVNAKRDSEIMMTCVSLIEKIQDEHYGGEYMDYHESRYKWLDVEGKPDRKQLEIEEISENYDEYFAKHKAAVRRVLADEKLQIFKLNGDDDKHRLAMNLGHYNEKRAQDLLFKLINRNIRGWWD